MQIKGYGYSNGKYIPLDKLGVSVLDLGLIHSDSTYDVCHVREGSAFRFEEHFNRFRESAKAQRLEIGYRKEEVVEIVKKCLKKAKLKDALVWMILTRGIPETGIPRDLHLCRNNLMVYVKPYYGISAGKNINPKGVSLYVSGKVRIPKKSFSARIKSFHWGDLTMAQYEAMDNKCDSAVLLNENGFISEGPGFNVMLIKNKTLYGVKADALLGITEKTMFDLAKTLKLKNKRKDLSVRDLLSADEVFITSTSGGLTFVNKLKYKGKTVSLKKGPTTEMLENKYWESHTHKNWSLKLV